MGTRPADCQGRREWINYTSLDTHVVAAIHEATTSIHCKNGVNKKKTRRSLSRSEQALKLSSRRRQSRLHRGRAATLGGVKDGDLDETHVEQALGSRPTGSLFDCCTVFFKPACWPGALVCENDEAAIAY